VLPFEFRGPTDLPDGYGVTQIAVSKPSWFAGYSGRIVYSSDHGDHADDLIVTAKSADDPDAPGHPYGVDCEITVNGRPGTYARTDDIVGSPPPGISDPAELQNGILESIDITGTYYYMNGPFDKEGARPDSGVDRVAGFGSLRRPSVRRSVRKGFRDRSPRGPTRSGFFKDGIRTIRSGRGTVSEFRTNRGRCIVADGRLRLESRFGERWKRYYEGSKTVFVLMAASTLSFVGWVAYALAVGGREWVRMWVGHSSSGSPRSRTRSTTSVDSPGKRRFG
jgi:hypothetical protein